MNEEVKELKERRNEIVGIKSAEEFFYAFCNFLRFVSDTPHIKRHALKVLKEKPTSSTIYAVNMLYSELNERWEEDYNAEKKIWSDILKKFTGTPNDSKTPILFTDLRASRSASTVFYTKLLDQIEKQSFSPYTKTTVVVDKDEHSISLARDKDACYSIKNRTKDKTKAPKRFRLICVLLSQRSAISIARLSELLDNKADTQNLKKDIRDINNLFRQKVFDSELILVEKRGSKNIYFLDRDTFIFKS
jgi:hypothetical protein